MAGLKSEISTVEGYDMAVAGERQLAAATEVSPLR